MPADTGEVKTLILRFRDLVTPSGETIALHRRLAQEQASVWWGWWNKAGETIPDKVFRALLESARSENGLQLFLVDSGNARVFRATCTDIRWSGELKRIASPKKKSTPSYYKDQEYLAWFKFSKILPDLVDESALKEYTYVQVDSFFEESASRYTPFYGKRIYSIRELIQSGLYVKQEALIPFMRSPFLTPNG